MDVTENIEEGPHIEAPVWLQVPAAPEVAAAAESYSHSQLAL